MVVVVSTNLFEYGESTAQIHGPFIEQPSSSVLARRLPPEWRPLLLSSLCRFQAAAWRSPWTFRTRCLAKVERVPTINAVDRPSYLTAPESDLVAGRPFLHQDNQTPGDASVALINQGDGAGTLGLESRSLADASTYTTARRNVWRSLA
jgi:hypothetical protein